MKKIAFIIGIIFLLALPLSQLHKSVQATKQSNDYPSIWDDQPLGSMKDSWLMGNRECTSYVAWKVFETYHYQVMAWGDARDWPAQAKSRALQVDDIPSVHSVAVNDTYKPGHVMWVEKLNSDGTIHVSEYNKDGKGNYYEEDINISGLKFIHFMDISR